jgi:hypothetical protein
MMISDAVTVDLTVEFIYLLGLVQPLMAIEAIPSVARCAA